MRLIDYLNTLEWSQADLAKHAGVSPTTVSRVLNEGTISRRSARAICIALSNAMDKRITNLDINELKMSDVRRPRKKKRRLFEGTFSCTRKRAPGMFLARAFVI
jgi:transcriptional regulator with XRE-family HTH domain